MSELQRLELFTERLARILDVAPSKVGAYWSPALGVAVARVAGETYVDRPPVPGVWRERDGYDEAVEPVPPTPPV